jgi:hypothetical protein
MCLVQRLFLLKLSNFYLQHKLSPYNFHFTQTRNTDSDVLSHKMKVPWPQVDLLYQPLMTDKWGVLVE